MIDIDLDKLIIKSFHKIVDDIIHCRVSRAILKGGRSSTKSQTISEAILIGCMIFHRSAVCLLKYGNALNSEIVSTFTSSIQYLGIDRYWKLRKSPYEYVLLDNRGNETNISIKFTGCDDPIKLKGYRPRFGSFRYIWFEELDNFKNLNEINSLIETMARGEGDHIVIMSYNPPRHTDSWVNQQYDAPCGEVLGYDNNTYREKVEIDYDGITKTVEQIVHHSTYLDVIKDGHIDWLGETFIAQATDAKNNNPLYYRFAYLGEIVGNNNNVFHNITDWRYQELNAPKINRGLDVSNGGNDPWAYNEWYWDKNKNDLYCLSEFGLTGTSAIDDVAINIKKHNKNNLTVYIDSAVPTFRVQLQNKGLNINPTKKGPDSVAAGILFLQSMNHIYIDKIKCPRTYKEFKYYEYKLDKNDEPTNELVDKNNHHIDATRYAFCMDIKFG